MYNIVKIASVLLLLFSWLVSYGQTLGNYPNTSVIAGQNVIVTPDAAPTSTTSIVAFTHTNFTGLLMVNPSTGILQVTNAKQAGAYLVTLKALNGNTTVTSSFTLTVTNPACSNGLFKDTANIVTGIYPHSIAMGDFNRDGKLDFATTNDGEGASNVYIRLGNGQGGFTASPNVPAGANPLSIAIGDFNKDGNQDFAAANAYSNSVAIRLGDGLGGFTGTYSVETGYYPKSVAIGDFNEDGNQDFVVVNNASSTISIRMGDGTGGFSGSTDMEMGWSASAVAIGDFNTDGNQDLAVTILSGEVNILLGDGAGNFSGNTKVPVGYYPYSIAIGDFNEDGNQDFATVTNEFAGKVFIRLGNGQGGFSGTTIVEVGEYPISINIGDFNGDGNQDIAVTNSDSNTLSFLMGNGSGEFPEVKNLVVAKRPYSIGIGDLNGDGILDFAAPMHGTTMVSIWLGDGTGGGQNTWLGITTDWNASSNWSTGKVPSTCTQVIIDTGVPNMPTVTGVNNTCYKLILQNGATINMAPGAKLNITGK